MRLPELIQLLTDLSEAGDSHNHLVLEAGPAFFVVTGARGRPNLRVEAATNALLPPDVRLGLTQVGALRSAGFAKEPDARGLTRTVAATDAPQLAPQLLDLFHRSYGQDPNGWTHQLTERRAEPTINPPLRDAILEVSRSKTAPARNALYRSLLEAQLMLVLDDSGAPAVIDEISGFDVYGVFSELASLASHDPRLMPYEVVRGYELWPRLAALKPGAVQVNPKTRLGGELYRNEVESLARAAGSASRALEDVLKRRVLQGHPKPDEPLTSAPAGPVAPAARVG